MKLFRHYNQEIVHLMLMIMISFLVIMISIAFVRYLSMAADGAMPLKNVIGVLGVVLPSFINMLLPISLFLAIVVGLNRLLHDNELLIGFACGMSYWNLIRNLLRIALPISILGFFLSFVIIPKMNDYQDQLTAMASQNETALNFIQSGRFFSLGDNQIIYVRNVDIKNRVSHDVFIYHNTGSATQIVLAPTGTVDATSNALANVSLNDGQEYEFTNTPGSLAVRMATFKQMVMTLIPSYDFSNQDLTAVSSIKLWQHRDLMSMVELEWRTILPIATLILTILGTVLSDLQPRTSRVTKIFYALAIFIIYFNLMSVAKSLMLTGRLPIFPGLFIVHFAFFALALVLLAWREGKFNLRIRA